MNVKKAKRAGFLHDIGKAVDQEVEGHHADIGADLCSKLNEDTQVISAIRHHHKEDQANFFSGPFLIDFWSSRNLNSAKAKLFSSLRK